MISILFVKESDHTVRLTLVMNKNRTNSKSYTYIYAFSRRFYPKRHTVYSGYTFIVLEFKPGLKRLTVLTS